MSLIEILPRPTETLANFIGQSAIKEDLSGLIKASKKSGRPLVDLLLSGPAGMGKSRLARSIATEMRAPLKLIQVGIPIDVSTFTAMMTSLDPGELILIDHLDQLREPVLSMVTSILENDYFDIVLDRLRQPRIPVPPCTFIALAEDLNEVEVKLRRQFKVYQLEPYPVREQVRIVTRALASTKVSIGSKCATYIAESSHGSPDVALLLARRVVEYLELKGMTTISINELVGFLGNRSSAPLPVSPSLLSAELGRMSSSSFEAVVAKVFESLGAQVELTGGSGDHGVDLIAIHGSDRIAVQCKRWEGTVGEAVIRDLIGALKLAHANVGCIVTTSGFSAEAIRAAKALAVKLVDLPMLIDIIREYHIDMSNP